ncbi:sulfotransferase [Actinomadura miaoliensis]|uniref:Sulfotransferase n=2 Tax=Actinomadura miaoliensis TaxID=430685 RepID=A0ABP7VDC1_9ACTN
MLHSHHRIAVPAETRFVIPAWTSRCDFGDLRDSRNRRALADWITTGRGTKFADLGLDADRTADEIAAAPPTLGSALAVVFRAYARRFDRVRWGDKRPSYFRYVDALRRMYPDAQFVHVVRDGRDCVASLKEMPWYKQDINHAICVWREAIDQGRRYAAELGPDAYYELQYERLVADPADELMRLCAFLGEEYDPAMTEPNRVARLTVPPQKKWHRRTHAAVDGGSVGSWTRRLEPWEVGLAEAAFGERLAEYGYEPSGAPRPTRGQLARLAKVSTHRRMSQSKQRMRERWRTRSEPNPVESLLTTVWTGPAPLIVEPASPFGVVPAPSPVPLAERRAEPARTGHPGI